MTPVSRFVRHRLHRRIFLWFGASIVLTILMSAGVTLLHSPGRFGYREGYERVRAFIGGQFAIVWDEPERRDALARRAARDLMMSIVLEDAQGAELAAFGEPCAHGDLSAPVQKGEQLLGTVRLCGGGPWRAPGGHSFAITLCVAGATLWAASGLIARRLTRPLGELVRVANEIGSGKLGARVTLRRSRYGEIGVLADAINDMAARIQKQIDDQRELLAAVSHEIRSPLARLRLQVELARDSQDRERTLRQLESMERELVEMNDLVGKLLASSRLDFAALDARELDVKELARGVLERSGLPSSLLDCRDGLRVVADPTLLARALSNLIDNAVAYGEGPTRLRISPNGAELEFALEDAGPGFKADELPNSFESFVRGAKARSGTSLGLGLALVRRIALAHGGRVWARNREEKGAEVGFSIRLSAAPSAG